MKPNDKFELLDRSVFGQPEAVKRCRRLLQQADQTPSGEPLGSMLLMGPTGTGKTRLALMAAQILFGRGSFLRLDMARFYTESLFAASLGPKGEIARNKKLLKQGCVVLLDEIDKVHDPKALKTWMTVLEEGRMQLTDGSELDFSNVFLFCTSNLACNTLLDESAQSHDILAQRVLSEHKKWMGPEVLARFRAAVVYRALSHEARELIAKQELEAEWKNQARLNNVLSTPDEASLLQFFAIKGYDPDLGARPMRDAVRDYVRQATYDARTKLNLPKDESLEGNLVLCEPENEEAHLEVQR